MLLKLWLRVNSWFAHLLNLSPFTRVLGVKGSRVYSSLAQGDNCINAWVMLLVINILG
jgi:hypothetical protein